MNYENPFMFGKEVLVLKIVMSVHINQSKFQNNGFLLVEIIIDFFQAADMMRKRDF